MTKNYIDFITQMENLDYINYLFDKKIIMDSATCDYCNVNMAMENSKNNKIGKAWRCSNKYCNKYQTYKSIFKNSFFDNKKLNSRLTLKILYYLANNTLLVEIEKFTNVTYKTITKIKKEIQCRINLYWMANPIKLGGPEVNVQVDETKLNFNMKSHKGREKKKPTWAITIVDTRTRPAKGYAEVVPSREASTLLPIISKVVRPGSYISTDKWSSYTSLNRINNYKHDTVNHKFNFVDPATKVHTQNVESYNNKLKLDIKKRKGIRDDLRSDFLQFFMFVDHYKKDAFYKILELIKV